MRDYHLTLSEQDVNVIGQVLAQAPWAVADPIIARLRAQCAAQNEAKNEAGDKAQATQGGGR